MASKVQRSDFTIVATAGLALIVLFGAGFAGPMLREPFANRPDRLPLSFPHKKHLDVNCTTCHHDFKDPKLKSKYGGMPCILCHRSDIPELKRGIEAEFHDFCKACHADKARWFAKHGPVRECTPCHTATEDGFMP